MIAAAVMTLLKLAAGILSGSLAVLSDAAHSGLDLAGSALTSSPSASVTSPPTKTTPTATARSKTCRPLPKPASWCLLRVDRLGSRRAHHRPRRESPPLSLAGAGARHFHRRGLWRSGNCAPWPCALGRRRWPRTPSTLPRTFGPRSPCWPDWLLRGSDRDSGLPPCNTPTPARPSWFRC